MKTGPFNRERDQDRIGRFESSTVVVVSGAAVGTPSYMIQRAGARREWRTPTAVRGARKHQCIPNSSSGIAPQSR